MRGDLGAWLAVVGFICLLALAASQLRKMWTAPQRVAIWNTVPGWWLWGGALWRGMVRASTIAIFASAATALLAGHGLVTGVGDPEARPTSVDPFVAGAGLTVILL